MSSVVPAKLPIPLTIVFDCFGSKQDHQTTIHVTSHRTAKDNVTVFVKHLRPDYKRETTFVVKRDACTDFILFLCEIQGYVEVVAGLEIDKETHYKQTVDTEESHNLKFWVTKFLNVQRDVSLID